MVNAIPATIKVMMPLAIGSSLAMTCRHRRRACGSGLLAFLLGIAVALKHLLGKKTAVPNPLDRRAL
jgi:hypothetical protein